jgi:hypothetical protein
VGIGPKQTLGIDQLVALALEGGVSQRKAGTYIPAVLLEDCVGN